MLRLNESFRLPHVADLVRRKLAGPEQSTLADADMALHQGSTSGCVQAVHEASTLPEAGRDALNDLLIRLRVPGI